MDDGRKRDTSLVRQKAGIGFEPAKRCARQGSDLLIAADEASIENAATALRETGSEVLALNADLSTSDGPSFQSLLSAVPPVI